MRITTTSHPDDIKNMEFFRQKSIEVLQAAGATKIWSSPPAYSRGGVHNRGTCRMGDDPKTSVVNKFHRAHDVVNLFVVDGSNLVTGGRNHPSSGGPRGGSYRARGESRHTEPVVAAGRRAATVVRRSVPTPHRRRGGGRHYRS